MVEDYPVQTALRISNPKSLAVFSKQKFINDVERLFYRRILDTYHMKDSSFLIDSKKISD